MPRHGANHDTHAVGLIGELMLGAEATSRGCTAFYPVGGNVAAIDLMVITPSNRRLTVQVKCQSTANRRTVDLGKSDKSNLDVVAVFHAGEGWFLLPAKKLGDKRTIRISEIGKYHDNWRLLR